MKSKGIYMPTIKMNSFKSLSNSKIELIDYEKISTFSNIQEQKEVLKMKSERLADFVYSNAKETEIDKKEFMEILLLDIINSEIVIQKLIDSVISK